MLLRNGPRGPHRSGVVPRAGWWPGHRRDRHRQGQSFGPPANHVPRQSRTDAAARAARPRHTPWGTPITIRYGEGAEVGYRWYAQKHHKPLYAFGHGLSYTTFDYKDFKVSGGETITATFTVTNTGNVTGADVPQVYLTAAPEGRRMRHLGFERVELPFHCCGPRGGASPAGHLTCRRP